MADPARHASPAAEGRTFGRRDLPMLVLAAITAIAGIGLNVLIGLAGQMSFGHVGFYAIGAYTVAVLTVTGKVAQFGRGVMADVSAKLLAQRGQRAKTGQPVQAAEGV